MHPCGRFNRNTLQNILHTAYAPQKPHACHRLDANTSGLVVIARTRHFAKLIQGQFARGEVHKLYLARIQGNPAWDRLTCDLPVSSEAGGLGSREVDEANGDAALTEFRVIQREEGGSTMVEARPLTGRTNQIRVHLWQLGHPVLGDPTYLPDRRLGDTQTLPIDAAPMYLHASQVSFIHPLTQEQVSFESSPKWL
jgi:RluA family pseudouridine synthase